MKNLIKYTWQQYDNDIKLLALQISKSYKVDLIIGLMRGGMIPAIQLGHLLEVQVEPLPPVNFESLLTRYHNILFVDEIVDSGKTLNELRIRVNKIVPDRNRVQYASLFYDRSAIDVPNFYVNSLNREEQKYWVEFPWELPSCY